MPPNKRTVGLAHKIPALKRPAWPALNVTLRALPLGIKCTDAQLHERTTIVFKGMPIHYTVRFEKNSALHAEINFDQTLKPSERVKKHPLAN